jgi:hypothetical protein
MFNWLFALFVVVRLLKITDMNTCILIGIGILIGWITKLPFALKWYRELKEYKEDKIKLYNKLITEIKKLPKDEQNKYWITAAYFRDAQ